MHKENDGLIILALFGKRERELIKRHSTQGGFGRLCGTCCGMATLQEWLGEKKESGTWQRGENFFLKIGCFWWSLFNLLIYEVA